MSKLKEKAEKYLKEHAAETVFGTSDGFLFLRKQDAKSHGATLASKKVETFGKGIKHLEVEDAVDVSGKQTTGGKSPSSTPKGGAQGKKGKEGPKPEPEEKPGK